jgi:probable rRNA maturation factor
MITIIVRRPFLQLISKQDIKETALATLSLNSVANDQNLSIVIGDDNLLHNLNSQFRQIDSSTDVLSFPSGESDPETGVINLGDIVISYPTAEKHAIESGNTIQNEIKLLVIHGVLHLLGYDHHTKEFKQFMWQKQNQVLTALHIKINRIYGAYEGTYES